MGARDMFFQQKDIRKFNSKAKRVKIGFGLFADSMIQPSLAKRMSWSKECKKQRKRKKRHQTAN